jgi:membrane fusion protein (multidrug efflux system)
MPIAFDRSLRSLRADAGGGALVAGATATALLVAWGVWFFTARVPSYEVSSSGRLEVNDQAHFVDAPLAGKVACIHLALGSHVEAGEVLAELDDRSERLALSQERARVEALKRQQEPLTREIQAEQEALENERLTARAGVQEARSLAAEAQAAATLSVEETQRLSTIHHVGGVSDSALARARSEQAGRIAAADARRSAVLRLDLDARARERAHAARLQQLQRERERIDGELGTLRASIDVRGERIERHRIVAPIAGTVGEVRPLSVGSYLDEGDRVATIVPRGELRMVAQFPRSALGRVRPGQRARLFLDGFAWTEYGTVTARVSAVATESVGGMLRVELAPEDVSRFPVRLEHGWPGAAEVAVETQTPAVLVLRAAGKLLAPRRESPPPGAVAGPAS